MTTYHNAAGSRATQCQADQPVRIEQFGETVEPTRFGQQFLLPAKVARLSLAQQSFNQVQPVLPCR